MRFHFRHKKLQGAFFYCRDLFSPFIVIIFPPFPPPLLVEEKGGGDAFFKEEKKKKKERKKPKDKYKGNLQQEVWSKDTVAFSFEFLHRNP